MDTDGPRRSSRLSPSTKWSLYAGVYASLWAALLVLALGNVADTIGTVLALPTDSPPLLLAGPVPVIGAGVWWAVVERPNAYTYLRGGAVGLGTALLTVAFWVSWLAVVYEPAAVRVGAVVVLAALVPAVLLGFLGGLPLLYARRRPDDRT